MYKNLCSSVKVDDVGGEDKEEPRKQLVDRLLRIEAFTLTKQQSLCQHLAGEPSLTGPSAELNCSHKQLPIICTRNSFVRSAVLSAP